MKRAFGFAVVVCVGFGLIPATWSQEVPGDFPGQQTYLMQVVLLLGGADGESSFDRVPKNAQQALKDIQDFLPFKSYRLLDVALIRSAGMADGRLSGPNGEDYHVQMEFTPIDDGERPKLLVRGFELIERTQATASLDRARDAYAKASGVALAPPVGRSLISSSFTIEPGETIVVGSSTLRSSTEALIVLLTAIP